MTIDGSFAITVCKIPQFLPHVPICLGLLEFVLSQKLVTFFLNFQVMSEKYNAFFRTLNLP